MALTARFASNCKTCGRAIAIGEPINWARRGQFKGTHHAACYQPKTKFEPTQAEPTQAEPTQAEPTQAEPTQAEPIETKSAPTPANSLEEMLAKRLEPFISIQRDEMTQELEHHVEEMIEKSLANRPKETVYIQSGRTLGTVAGHKHEHFDLLVQLAEMRENVLLYGEAGSGKTTAAKMLADLLGVQFYYLQVQEQLTDSRIMGFVSPIDGKYYPSDFYTAYTEGGVFLFDEIGLGNANLLASLNAALENGTAAFPKGINGGGRQHRHPNFVCIAADNSNLLGASVTFNSRNELDGATRDRFCFVEWNTDLTLEMQLASNTWDKVKPWVEWVQNVRALAKTAFPKLMCTPRASYRGARMIPAHIPIARVADMVVFRGIDPIAKQAILAKFPLPSITV